MDHFFCEMFGVGYAPRTQLVSTIWLASLTIFLTSRGAYEILQGQNRSVVSSADCSSPRMKDKVSTTNNGFGRAMHYAQTRKFFFDLICLWQTKRRSSKFSPSRKGKGRSKSHLQNVSQLGGGKENNPCSPQAFDIGGLNAHHSPPTTSQDG